MKHIGWIPVCVKDYNGVVYNPWPKWFETSRQRCAWKVKEHAVSFKFKFVKVYIEEPKK